MDGYREVLRALGRIEGELIGIRKLAERVSKLETWLHWLRGAWAALVLCFVYLCRLALGR
jgi:CDP-diglyceride synthetase